MEGRTRGRNRHKTGTKEYAACRGYFGHLGEPRLAGAARPGSWGETCVLSSSPPVDELAFTSEGRRCAKKGGDVVIMATSAGSRSTSAAAAFVLR